MRPERDQYAALLPIRVRVSGPDHPDTLIVRANLALWSDEAGGGATPEVDLLPLSRGLNLFRELYVVPYLEEEILIQISQNPDVRNPFRLEKIRPPIGDFGCRYKLDIYKTRLAGKELRIRKIEPSIPANDAGVLRSLHKDTRLIKDDSRPVYEICGVCRVRSRHADGEMLVDIDEIPLLPNYSRDNSQIALKIAV
jgi:hypothetical protein